MWQKEIDISKKEYYYCPSRLGKVELISPKDNAEKGKNLEFVTYVNNVTE
jgi:hypothetical protein